VDDAAKESNLPGVGLPRPAGFEVRDMQVFYECLRACECFCVRSEHLGNADFGTRVGTRLPLGPSGRVRVESE
jgi:hypothetical protein